MTETASKELIPVWAKDDGILTTKPVQKFVHSTYRGALQYSGYYENTEPIGYLVKQGIVPKGDV